jgi:hypothetical protein
MSMPNDHLQAIVEVVDALTTLACNIPLPDNATEAETALEAIFAVQQKVLELLDSAMRDNQNTYWWGVVTGLRKAGREDLIPSLQRFLQRYPVTQEAQELIQTMLELHRNPIQVN